MTKILANNLPISQKGFKFLKDVLNSIGVHNYDSLFNEWINHPSFMAYDESLPDGERYVSSMLCLFHNEHNIDLSHNGINSSMNIDNKNHNLYCWVCGTQKHRGNLNLNSIIQASPEDYAVRSVNDKLAAGHSMNKTAVVGVQQFINAMSEIYEQYGPWMSLITQALQQNPQLKEQYSSFFNKNTMNHTDKEQVVLDLFKLLCDYGCAKNTLIPWNNQQISVIQWDVKQRGLYGLLMKPYQQFFLGADLNTVQNNLKEFVYTYLPQHNFNASASDVWKIMNAFNLALKFTNRVITPITNTQGEIVNFNLRSLDPHVDAKYLYLNANVDDQVLQSSIERLKIKNDNHLFNLDKLQYSSKIYVNEGIYDTLALSTNQIPAVCSFTKAVGQAQKELLSQNNFKEIVFAYDNDSAGINGAINACFSMIPYKKFCYVSFPAMKYYDLKKQSTSEIKDWNELQQFRRNNGFNDIPTTGVNSEELKRILRQNNNGFFDYQAMLDECKHPDLLSMASYFIFRALNVHHQISAFRLQTLLLIANLYLLINRQHLTASMTDWTFYDTIKYPINPNDEVNKTNMNKIIMDLNSMLEDTLRLTVIDSTTDQVVVSDSMLNENTLIINEEWDKLLKILKGLVPMLKDEKVINAVQHVFNAENKFILQKRIIAQNEKNGGISHMDIQQALRHLNAKEVKAFMEEYMLNMSNYCKQNYPNAAKKWDNYRQKITNTPPEELKERLLKR